MKKIVQSHDGAVVRAQSGDAKVIASTDENIDYVAPKCDV